MKIHCRKMRKNMQIKFKMLTAYIKQCKTWKIFIFFMYMNIFGMYSMFLSIQDFLT